MSIGGCLSIILSLTYVHWVLSEIILSLTYTLVSVASSSHASTECANADVATPGRATVDGGEGGRVRVRV